MIHKCNSEKQNQIELTLISFAIKDLPAPGIPRSMITI